MRKGRNRFTGRSFDMDYYIRKFSIGFDHDDRKLSDDTYLLNNKGHRLIKNFDDNEENKLTFISRKKWRK